MTTENFRWGSKYLVCESQATAGRVCLRAWLGNGIVDWWKSFCNSQIFTMKLMKIFMWNGTYYCIILFYLWKLFTQTAFCFLVSDLFFAIWPFAWIIFTLKRFKNFLFLKIRSMLQPLIFEREKRVLCSVSERTPVLSIFISYFLKELWNWYLFQHWLTCWRS